MLEKYLFNLSMLLAFAVLFSNCFSENDYVVHQELQQYFDSFEEEANKRGMDISLSEAAINGIIMDIAEARVYGQCATNASNIKTVRVDRDFWENASDSEREFLVFHELGHCALSRSHLDTRDASGSCTSIMHSGTSSCRFRYNSSTREGYLDELFQ